MNRQLFACAMTLALTVTACASPERRAVRNPPEAAMKRSAGAPAPSRREAGDEPREVSLTLQVGMIETKIRNPNMKRLDDVRLRGYKSEQTNPNAPLVAPTIRVAPGEIVRLTIDNKLDPEEGCEGTDHNVPHCFNSTNMHAHGMWVSPEGNSDNVFVRIKPQKSFEYKYEVPPDHPSGTFWYHPHLHGSTALQVGSGMAGALIVEGTRVPTPSKTGDIDPLLRYDDGSAFIDRVMVLQQIPYACRDNGGQGEIKKNSDKTWKCEDGDVGEITRYDDQLTPSKIWQQSGRFTTVNGRTVEPLEDRGIVGRVERWRFIHAGVRATIRVQFRKRIPNSTPFENVSAAEQEQWLAINCDAQQVVPHWQMAADGLTLSQLAERRSTILQPGYRSDLLVVFPSTGDYCVIDEPATAAASVNGITSQQLLTVISVDGKETIGDLPAHLRARLKSAATSFMPADVRDKVIADLDAGFSLASFVPHEDLTTAMPTGTQTLFFSFLTSSLGVGTSAADAKPYDPDRMDRTLTLGNIDDWTLLPNPAGAPHPFHIHINPFQIMSVTNASGTDLTQVPESQYFGLKGVWKDTVVVEGGATVRLRTQYRRYLGKFVLHCHILDHEDRGMMQNVEIVKPAQAPDQ